MCPFCGDKSFKKRICGIYLLGVIDDTQCAIQDIETVSTERKDDLLIHNIIIKMSKI